MKGDSLVVSQSLNVSFLRGASARMAPYFGSALPTDVKMKQVGQGMPDGNSKSSMTREAVTIEPIGTTK